MRFRSFDSPGWYCSGSNWEQDQTPAWPGRLRARRTDSLPIRRVSFFSKTPRRIVWRRRIDWGYTFGSPYFTFRKKRYYKAIPHNSDGAIADFFEIREKFRQTNQIDAGNRRSIGKKICAACEIYESKCAVTDLRGALKQFSQFQLWVCLGSMGFIGLL